MQTLKNFTPIQWLIILLSLNSAIAGATAQLTDLFGASVAHYIVSAVTFANTILGAFMVPFTGQSAQIDAVRAMPGVEHIEINAMANATLAAKAMDKTMDKIAPTPEARDAVAKIAAAGAVLLALLIGSSWMNPASAQTRRAPQITGDPVADIKANLGINQPGTGLTGSPLNDIIGALDVKLLPDLQYALKLATASGSKVTAPCYQAWIDIINVRQKAVQDSATPPQAIPLPDPHIITDFEKLVELRNSLQPDSEFMIRCSPVASMVKKDIVGFIGLVISGGAGLATLVPGL